MIVILLLISLYLVYYDYKHLKVPNLINLLLLITIIVYKLYNKVPPSEFIIPGVVSFGTLLLVFIFSKGKLGMGDIKYSAITSMYFGYLFWLGSIIYAATVALLISIFLLATKKIKRDTRIPFIPFLVAGSIINYLLPVTV